MDLQCLKSNKLLEGASTFAASCLHEMLENQCGPDENQGKGRFLVIASRALGKGCHPPERFSPI